MRLSKTKAKTLLQAEIKTFLILSGWGEQSTAHSKYVSDALGKSAATLQEISKRFSETEIKELTDSLINNANLELGVSHDTTTIVDKPAE